MQRKYKIGAFTGTFFASAAFVFAKLNGFNRETFVVFLYIYVLLGIVSRFDAEDAASYIKSLENITWVKREEMRIKKVFTGEEYEIEGIKKVKP